MDSFLKTKRDNKLGISRVGYENVIGDNETLKKTVIVGQRELCDGGGRYYRTSMGSGTIDCHVTLLHHHLDI